jgi:hypothetical protein
LLDDVIAINERHLKQLPHILAPIALLNKALIYGLNFLWYITELTRQAEEAYDA